MSGECCEASARTQLQAADFTAGHATQSTKCTTPFDDERSINGDSQHGTQTSYGVVDTTTEQPDDELKQRTHEQPDEDGRQLRQRRADHRRANTMSLASGKGVQQSAARTKPATMTRHGCWVHHYASPEQVNTPTEVEFFAEERNVRSESRYLTKHVVAHQQASRRKSKNISHRVVLLLITLARVDYIHELTGAVTVEPDMLQHIGRIPLHQLRPHHCCVGTERLIDQCRDRIGTQRHVVVQNEEEPLTAIHEREGLVDNGAKARVALHRSHEGGRHCLTNSVGHRRGG